MGGETGNRIETRPPAVCSGGGEVLGRIFVEISVRTMTFPVFAPESRSISSLELQKAVPVPERQP